MGIQPVAAFNLRNGLPSFKQSGEGTQCQSMRYLRDGH